jgi:prepilin-type N-terminal cleavage/methylation domain-containing protein
MFNSKIASKHPFTLLELMIAIAILASAGSILYWRLHGLIEKQRFQSDVRKVCDLFMQSRIIAINTRCDWQLHMQEVKGRWDVRLVCIEDPDRSPAFGQMTSLGSMQLFWNGAVMQTLALDFYSSGLVGPVGNIRFQLNPKSPSVELDLVEFFQTKENSAPSPLHPRNLTSSVGGS